MQQDQIAPPNHRYFLFVSLKIASGCVLVALTTYILNGSDHLISHIFLANLGWLGFILYLRKFKPEQFRKMFGSGPQNT